MTLTKPIRKMGIYLRKSRAENGIKDLEKHKEYLVGLCVNHFKCDYELFEEIESSVTLERNELQRLRKWVADGRLDGVMVNAVDRLSRSDYQFLKIIQEYFIDKGMTRLFVREQENVLIDPTTRAILVIQATLSQAEYSFIVKRLNEGKKTSAEKGITSGKKVYGYRYNKEEKKIELVPEEAKVVREIADLLLIGDTYGSVCDKINATGVRTRAGKLFDIHNIKSIIESPMIRGHINVKWKDGSETLKENMHDEIINDAEYFKIMEILNDRADNYKNLSKAPTHYLQGILKCPKCGKAISISASKKSKYINGERIYIEGSETYYVRPCRNQRTKEKCGNKGCNVEKVEEHVRSEVKNFEKDIDEKIKYFIEIDGEELKKSHKEKIGKLNQAINKLDQEESYLFDLLKKKTIDEETYKKGMNDSKDQKANLQNQLDEAKNKFSNIDIKANLNHLNSLKKSIQQWDNLESDQKRKLVQMLFPKIEYKKFEGSNEFKLKAYTNLKIS